MKKRIFWIPQLATVDKRTKKTILDADSNIVILKCIINNLKNDFDFIILLPNEEHCNIAHNKIFKDDEVKIIKYNEQNKSAFSLRYDFNFNFMYDLINVINPDIIVNNTAPLSRNIGTILHLLKLKTRLISFIHFLDLPSENKVPKNVSYFIRQADGLMISDLCVFQSHTVKEKTIKAIKKYFTHYMDDAKINLKTIIWNGTYSQIEIEVANFMSENRRKKSKNEKKKIMFPNRLSSTNYSNHIRFFEAIRNISKERNDFSVLVNNPTRYMSFDEIKKLCPNLNDLSEVYLDRESYLTLLHKVDIGVALFTQEGHGGVSSKEMQAAGCLPVFPKINEYQYLMPDNYKGFVKPDLSNLEESLNYTLDIIDNNDEYMKLIEEAKKRIYKRDSIEYNIPIIRKSLKGELI